MPTLNEEQTEQPARQTVRIENPTAKQIYAAHRGALAASAVFKTLAVVVLIGGVLSAFLYAKYLHGHGTPSAQSLYAEIGIAVAAIIVASVAAFFAYVLDLLVQIEGNTRENAYNAWRGTLPTPPTRRV